MLTLVIIFAVLFVGNAEELLQTEQPSTCNCSHVLNVEKEIEAYPTLPSTSFTCWDRLDGYYADVEVDCTLFHYCQTWKFPNGLNETVKWDFSCPEGTIFNQRILSCTPPSIDFECRESPSYFWVNYVLTAPSTAIPPSCGHHHAEQEINSAQFVHSSKPTYVSTPEAPSFYHPEGPPENFESDNSHLPQNAPSDESKPEPSNTVTEDSSFTFPENSENPEISDSHPISDHVYENSPINDIPPNHPGSFEHENHSNSESSYVLDILPADQVAQISDPLVPFLPVVPSHWENPVQHNNQFSNTEFNESTDLRNSPPKDFESDQTSSISNNLQKSNSSAPNDNLPLENPESVSDSFHDSTSHSESVSQQVNPKDSSTIAGSNGVSQSQESVGLNDAIQPKATVQSIVFPPSPSSYSEYYSNSNSQTTQNSESHHIAFPLPTQPRQLYQ